MSVINYLANESTRLTSDECNFLIDVIKLRTYPGSVSRSADTFNVSYEDILHKLMLVTTKVPL